MNGAKIFHVFPSKIGFLFSSWRSQWLAVAGLSMFAVFSWLPNSYKEMVDWPWVISWQGGFFTVGLSALWFLKQSETPLKLLGYGLDEAVGAVTLAVVLSSATAEFPEVATLNCLLYLFYVLSLYVFHNWVNQPQLHYRLLWAWLCVVSSVTGLISLLLWEPASDMWLSSNFYTAIRNGLPLGHHNFMGGYLVLSIPIIATFAIAQTGWRKWFGFVLLSLSIVALYTTGSRGAWVGAIVIALTTIVASIRKSKGIQRQRVLIGSALVVCLISMALFSNPRVRSLVTIQTATTILSPSRILQSDGPAMDRVFMTQATNNIVRGNPFLGVGPGNLSRVYNLYRPIESGTGLELVQQMHSLPLQVLSELGLVGFTAYIWFIACLIRLWLKLSSIGLQRSDRYLLNGVGAGFLGYGISSLTDYQLENIGIASSLLLMILLIIGLANQENISPKATSHNISKSLRRVLAFSIIGFLGITVRFWIPMDISMYLNHSAATYLVSGDTIQANRQWTKASNIAYWDPVPKALSGQTTIELISSASSEEQSELLDEQAILNYEAALREAPNDTWFNNNLAVLYLPTDNDKSEYYASRAVQLSPRTQNNLYFTLGLSYLSQGRYESAVDAFALELLEDPEFISMELWKQAPFDAIRSETVAQATSYYRQLLEAVTPDSSRYNQVYESLTLIRWWTDSNNDRIDIDRVSPLLQAVFLSEDQPEKSLSAISAQIRAGNNSKSIKLLSAWMAPQKYLDSYLSDKNINSAEKALVPKSTEKQNSIRDWFASAMTPVAARRRYGASFTYRNADANYILSILQPGPLDQSAIVQTLGLFNPWPRHFPELDQLIERIRAQKLELPHPTQNSFSL